MGLMNLLKANYTQKLGQTVGSEWKGKPVIRTYTKPTKTAYPDQVTVRTAFGELNSFVALFSDEIKTLNALNTRGKSVRNEIVHINHSDMGPQGFDPTALIISKGGLQTPTGVAVATPAAGNTLTVTFNKVTGTLISTWARVVAVAVDATDKKAFVGFGLNSTGTIAVSGTFATGEQYHLYTYLLDKRGSSKVASLSSHIAVTIS
jgi:hypothetical protein